MSTLTKICVVVLVVLVLFASGPFIQQAVTGPNWKQACQEQKQRAEVAEASSRKNMQNAQTYLRLYEDAQGKIGTKGQEYLTQIAGRDVEISRLTGQLAARVGEVTELITFNKAFEVDLEAQIALTKNILAQLDDKRVENTKLSDQLRQAQHTIKEEQTIRENLSRSVKVFQEQNAQKDIQIADLTDQLASGGAQVGPARTVAAGVKIDAAVTAVKNDLASLNVGSASGVKIDMEFTIYRGENFVAHLRIADVGVADSTGIILNRRQEPKVGDKASTNLE